MCCMLVTLIAALFYIPDTLSKHQSSTQMSSPYSCLFVLFCFDCPIAFNLGCRSDTVWETIHCSLDDSLMGKQLNTVTTPSSYSFSDQLLICKGYSPMSHRDPLLPVDRPRLM